MVAASGKHWLGVTSSLAASWREVPHLISSGCQWEGLVGSLLGPRLVEDPSGRERFALQAHSHPLALLRVECVSKVCDIIYDKMCMWVLVYWRSNAE